MQSEIVNRLVGISHVHLGSVMIPIHNVETVDVNSDHSALLNKLNKCAFTRLPVTEGRAGNIIVITSYSIHYTKLYESSAPDIWRIFAQPLTLHPWNADR